MTDFKRYSIEEMRAQFNVMPGSDRFDEKLKDIESDCYVHAMMREQFRPDAQTAYRQCVARKLRRLTGAKT